MLRLWIHKTEKKGRKGADQSLQAGIQTMTAKTVVKARIPAALGKRRVAMELTYIQSGDYLIPNLRPDDGPDEPLRKYGMLRRDFLKENRKVDYTTMLFEGTLWGHLLELQEQEEERLDFLMGSMAEAEGADEDLKASDQMAWVRKMNSIKARAEEIVLSEMIYT